MLRFELREEILYCSVRMAELTDDRHHFEFDLDRGIRQQVVEKLEESPLLPFVKNAGPPSSGIYALYYKGELVYLGKAARPRKKLPKANEPYALA
jgi:hypothetical protein